MAIGVGDRIPSVTLKHIGPDGMAEITTDQLFAAGTVVLFAVPGAFTPTCSIKHLPSFIEHAAALKEKGVDRIVGMAVNDPFVMKAWGEQTGAGDAVFLLADGNGTFTRALDLEMDGTGYGLGMRSKRFALVARDGVVTHIAVEKPGAYEVSSAEAVLAAL
jgi:peroxiredoxin